MVMMIMIMIMIMMNICAMTLSLKLELIPCLKNKENLMQDQDCEFDARSSCAYSNG